MKKSLVALALFGAFAAVAHAQSSVVIYGTVDAGVTKKSGSGVTGATGATSIGKRNNNKLGFMGTEDLGNGLKALFQLETRFEPDTGTIESGSTNKQRPLFQGQSRVGLQGSFGTVRLGRGLTAFQESIIAFDPWNGVPSVAGFITDLQTAGYNSDPLSDIGGDSSKNRFSNALFYNTPVFNGFQANATVASKEANGNPAAIVGKGTAASPQYAIGAQASSAPYSLSATYKMGPVAAMAAYERNAIETKLWSVAASYNPLSNLKLMASYQKQDQGHTVAVNEEVKSWIVGANYTIGAGKILAAYGQKTPDGLAKTKQASLGYEYSLSKRTYVYVDASNKKVAVAAAPTTTATTNFYGVGVSHNF